MSRPSFVRVLRCSRCSETVSPEEPQHLCACGGPLLVDYDLDAVGASVDPGAIRTRRPDMWRYEELLPAAGDPVTLGEGLTPLRRVPRVGEGIGVPDLWLKDEGCNPTGTFKARGAACGITRARDLGVSDVCLPTAGNAGGAWAAYGAAGGVRVHVAMPRSAPEANRIECLAHGADLVPVDGLISDAGALVGEWVAERGWYDASTLREPYRIEGKKTLGLEIAEQLGWRLPDAIVYPAGGGVGLIGIHRAVGQLRRLGWVEGPPPKLFAIQAEGCAPIVRAFDEGAGETLPWEGAATIATGLCVPSPLGGPLVLEAMRQTGGAAVAVSDEEILEAISILARGAGILAAPEGAAALAGVRALRGRGLVGPEERVVVINTGSGVKYPEVLARAASRRVSAR